MRNRFITCLFFVLKILTSLFLLWVCFEFSGVALYGTVPSAERLIALLTWLMAALEFGTVGASVFSDARNIVRGLPLPTVFFYTETNHGDSIREVKAGICEEPVEYMAVFTMMGFKLIEITNFQPSTIYYNKVVEKIYKEHPGAIDLHNHPGRDNLPFSSADIRSAMRRKVSRSIVVTRSSVYELFLPREFSDKEIDRACKIIEKSERLFCHSREDKLRACEQMAAEFGMTFKQSARPN